MDGVGNERLARPWPKSLLKKSRFGCQPLKGQLISEDLRYR